MARKKVKGTRQYQMKVVPHRPYSRAVAALGGAALLAVSTGISYYAGQHNLRVGLDQQTLAYEATLRNLERIERENEDLRQRVATAEQSLAIGEQAAENVRADLVARDKRIAELQQDISFYRGLMAPQDGSDGVSIARFSLSETDIRGRYHYKLLVQQSATGHKLVTGNATITVVGQEQGEPKSYALSDLSAQVEKEKIPLRFKYFQNIDGELQLPEGFEPEGVEMTLKSSARKGFNIEQRYGWLVQKS